MGRVNGCVVVRKMLNKTFQFVPALMGLHRTAFSPLRCVKATAEYWR